MYGLQRRLPACLPIALRPESQLLLRHYSSIHQAHSTCASFLLLNPVNRHVAALLIQSRGLRHKTGAGDNNKSEDGTEEESTKSSSTTNGDDDEAEKITSAKKLDEKFRVELAKFMLNFREQARSDPMRMRNFRVFRDEFIDKFNEEHAKSGYKVERQETERYEKRLALVLSFAMASVIFVMWLAKPKTRVLPQHREIVRQTPVTFDEFVRDYLGAGEVQAIHHYPALNLAVALLQPGAMIHGQPYTGQGVPIRLDASFSFNPEAQFTIRVRDVERQMSIDPREQIPIAISPMVPPIVYLFYMLGCIGFFFFVRNGLARVAAKGRFGMFKIAPRSQSQQQSVEKPSDTKE